MFTGIIREVGRVDHALPGPEGLRLEIETALAERLSPGDSLAINGACLTVVKSHGHVAAFDVVPESLSLTNLGTLRPSARVNLEPPLAAGEPIGGHFVQGHIDGLGTVGAIDRQEEGVRLIVRVEPSLAGRMIPKGSIAVDGVSLTIVDVERDAFSVALIPFTLQHTTLGELRAGDRVNIELDMLGKYVQRFLEGQKNRPAHMELLRRAGFLP